MRRMFEHDLERLEALSAGRVRFHRTASDPHSPQALHSANAGHSVLHAHELGRSDGSARRAELQLDGCARDRLLEGLRLREIDVHLLDRRSRDARERSHHEHHVQQDDRGTHLQSPGRHQRQALLSLR